MKWHHVAGNWPAFYEAIIERWPDVDEAELDEIDGDQRGFLRYIAEIEGLEPEEAREEVREWLAGEIPADVVMDESHDNISIRNSAKYVGEGEDEYDDDARFGDDDEDGETG
ncbi:MAG TPA: hypothetical protein PKC09_08255 [Paracoccus sp. (in: a-proteobacteria)]|uniref:hypothetical protein n=1 Tax=uncultured Paracoccus sp. TaxID=189685 RepID=UPI002601F607|nr:hypothetical protein [uncultured Paracoccus sp.]HMQ41250.1 hypothetical protein [Paracoccus sp. (in: a-proteobacteria)]HMR37512.1 hypothetical protein [Paracoccus sp. (in: a-proteobacteria)]